jgi:predicted Zn-dependent peptidase
MKMNLRIVSLVILLCYSLSSFAYRYDYQTFSNDPTKTLVYTLPNGLKVFMSVNKDRPRIQTYIAVRAGGKNDPAETTGLAHYFEHLMFKGTEQFGTQNYAAEKPMLDAIEQLFETYRMTSDSLQRAQIYHQIDSISYQASLIGIPNEYDKLMSLIGASGTNAYTSQDVTCYTEDIPSNQIENWAKIQGDRFLHPVLRGFHTELETIYEEKNMSLTKDIRKVIQEMLSALFPSHPYGTQTVLGTQENLKNPSITNVKKFYSEWYVPNNMAIVMAGDFDPDNAVDIITKYFSEMKPNANLPVLKFSKEQPITSPIVREVKGLDAESVFLAWRLPEAKNEDMVVLQAMGELMQNGKCGLIDLGITLPQRLLSTSCFPYAMADQGSFIIMGTPKEGQTLDEVRSILLEPVAKLRAGDFDDSLVQAVINNMLKDYQEQLESNEARADMLVEAFVNGEDWAEASKFCEKLKKVTKADIVAIANKYFNDNNYVVINKLQGKDENELKIAKPQITPIATNRDVQSQFVTDIQNSAVEPIEPHFVNYDTELTRTSAKKGQVELLYTQNHTNELFELTFIYEYGVNACRPLSFANKYLSLLGTPDMTSEEIKKEFYRLGCDYSVSVENERSYIVLSGLSKNMEAAVKLLEKLVNNAVPDKDVWATLAADRVKQMNDNKLNQSVCFSYLVNYARYGSADNDPLIVNGYKPDELAKLDPKEITDAVKALNSYKHRVVYYGPLAQKDVVKMVDRVHSTAKKLADVPQGKQFKIAETKENVIYVAPYDARQLYMSMTSNRGNQFDAAKEPARSLYNEYFDGSMNSIVFQEMRESRSLAYSASGYMSRFNTKGYKPYIYVTQIATQNDKLIDATTAFEQIINDMPQSQPAFEIAKSAIDARLRTARTIKSDIAWSWIRNQDLGVDHDLNADLFAKLPGFTLNDVVAYQQSEVKGRTYTYAILANTADIDLDGLNKFGRVVILKLEDIFGY